MSKEQPLPLTFIVNSGRCGSTMLSRMLHYHPDVLSASEFMNTVRRAMGGALFAEQEVSGEALWDALRSAESHADAAILAGTAGAVTKQFGVAYPYDSGRFRPDTGIPRICHFVLPMLSEDPDELFDHLAGEVPSWPARPPADQYRAILEYLAGLLGRRVIAERSGGSIAIPARLFAHYPDARFVYMYRDGPDSALSMSRFPTTRTMVLSAMAAEAAGVPLTTPLDEVVAAAPEEFKSLLVPPIDTARFMSYPIPVPHFGSLWSGIMSGAADGLNNMPRECWTILKYESLVADSRAELTRLAEFLGVPATSQWLDDACGMINSGYTGTAAVQLDPDTLAALRAACEPGEKIVALMEAGHASWAAAGPTGEAHAEE
jgi:Sulfotransferase family